MAQTGTAEIENKSNPLNGLPVKSIFIPTVIKQDIDNSTSYMVPLSGMSSGIPYQQFSGLCGGRNFTFNFSWNWDAELQYNDKIELLRNITRGMRVYKGLASYPVNPSAGPIRCIMDNNGNLTFFTDISVVPNFDVTAPGGNVKITYDNPPILGMNVADSRVLKYSMEGESGGGIYERKTYVVMPIGQAVEPDNIRDVVEGYAGILEMMQNFQESVMDRIAAVASQQPVPPLEEDVRFEYVVKTEELIDAMERSQWSYNSAARLFDLYRNTLLLRDLLTLEPPGGFLNYIVNYPESLPDYKQEIAYIKQTFIPLINLFKDIEFYHNKMYWRVSVIADGSPTRSFVLRPSQTAFAGSDDYSITTIASQADAITGNILYDQLPYVVLNVETRA